tara:strand:- start:19926 stop:20540 length:615 start_codon:yes stop_codon:yes gene_type:complete
MSNKLSLAVLSFLLIILSGCAEQYSTDQKIYTFLEVCYEYYYLNYDVDVSAELANFETVLINEGHLSDSTGEAYSKLLDFLSQENYFNPPLKFDGFNNVVLYKVPDDLVGCAQSIYGIDSSLVKQTNYFKAQQKIREQLANSQEISINQLFKYNSDYLDSKTLTSPFVKQSILQLLYRWYFKSKYDREIPLSEENLMKSDTLSP